MYDNIVLWINLKGIKGGNIHGGHVLLEYVYTCDNVVFRWGYLPTRMNYKAC